MSDSKVTIEDGRITVTTGEQVTSWRIGQAASQVSRLHNKIEQQQTEIERLSNITYLASRDYETIRHTPGYYWARGVTTIPDRWILLSVRNPGWTKESGKTHCLWYYVNYFESGWEITKGEWIFIPRPD